MMDENNDVNTRINFWVNVKRYLALKDISNATLAKRIKSSEQVVVKLMEKESNIPIESVGKYARALEVQPIDLFEVWTDEEWGKVRTWRGQNENLSHGNASGL